MSDLLRDLNPQQRQAVETTEGPLLVVAGAGAGKTRVITYRIAYLIEQDKARPEGILAVTFTNKAADEMRQRVAQLVPGLGGGSPWTSTFHSFCARLLRREAPVLGLRRDFSIYADDDQERLVRGLLKELGEDDRAWVARGVLERISRAKTAGRGPDDWESSGNPLDRRQAEVYRRYQEALRRASRWTNTRTPTARSTSWCGCWRRPRRTAARRDPTSAWWATKTNPSTAGGAPTTATSSASSRTSPGRS
jgi:DNA helicase-2/ATP-dependent DNA helicase PcrA